MADNMKGLTRTHYCGEVEGIGNEVTVGGFTQRIRDKGVPFLRGNGRGDEHVVVKVLTPQKLSTRQKELLKEFAELSGDSVNPEQKSFMDTLKNLFK